MNGRFLKHARIDSYGAFFGRTVGPFGPNLNVVYGENEAGKSTLASFIGGVLFGWEDGRSERNTYKPENAERAGALFFEDSTDSPADEYQVSGELIEVARTRNADGIQGPEDIVSDIDRETFKTMFSLTSDELRSLKGTSDVTAHLLTAGSGTGSSPSAAFVEVEQRIATYTSRAASATNSLVQLSEQLENLHEQIDQEVDRAARHRSEDRERRELESARAVAADRIDELNRNIEQASAWRVHLERIDRQSEQYRDEIDTLRRDEAKFLATRQVETASVPERLLHIDSATDRTLHDRLDDFADQQARISRSLDIAHEDYQKSAAAYEALEELDADAGTSNAGGVWRTRRIQTIVSVILTLLFVAAGIPLFMHGRQIASLSYTVLGLGLVLMAFLLAVATLVIMFRPDKTAERQDSRMNDARWVMLQDRRKLDASKEAKAQVDADLRAFIVESGIGTGDETVKQARALLDDARDVRARQELVRQRTSSLDMRMAQADSALADLEIERRRLESAIGEGEGVTVHDLDALIDRYAEERDAVMETYQDMSQRFGELGEVLSHARSERDLDSLKLEYQQVRTRISESKAELVTLLLARRILEKSIDSWQSASQPEVYREASRLLEMVTGGKWTKVSMSADGKLVVTDSNLNVREPRHLSLGTCQQLYLVLRIALLSNADNVGRSIPVLADDILVNFDASRREGAVRALCELAKKRQVIMFTCHREIVDSVRSADPNCTYIEL